MRHRCDDGRRPARRARGWGMLLVGSMVGLVGCNANDLTNVIPSNTIADPAALETTNGALLTYKGALVSFGAAFSGAVGGSYTLASGLLSDELSVKSTGGLNRLDLRELPENTTGDVARSTFEVLQGFRIVNQQGTGALHKHGQSLPKSYIGQLLAYEAYAEIMLAELFCSGIPLSYAPYGGDIIHGVSHTTEKVYEHALALLDSALLYSTDSARILNMVRVGRGRVLLNQGRFADAAAAVKDVPTTFVHPITYVGSEASNATNNVFRKATFTPAFTIADTQGTNGLNYVPAGDSVRGANRDPRVKITRRFREPFVFSTPYILPLKYADAPLAPPLRDTLTFHGTSPVMLADGVEARLIEAEAALQANEVGTWTAKLNELRAAATTLPGFTPRLTAMPALTADSTTTASATRRVDVMFRERAFWLFLTGHRLGDMRRLIRQYGRTQDQVFPIGAWVGNIALQYGEDVNAPIPLGESLNPHYQGCVNRDA